MCNDIPDGTLTPYEALEMAKEQDWIPVITILGKATDDKGRPSIDRSHLHYLYVVNEEEAMMMALRFIAEMRQVMLEKEARRVQEN